MFPNPNQIVQESCAANLTLEEIEHWLVGIKISSHHFPVANPGITSSTHDRSACLESRIPGLTKDRSELRNGCKVHLEHLIGRIN
jgi:hypothetical protein